MFFPLPDLTKNTVISQSQKIMFFIFSNKISHVFFIAVASR